MLLILFTATLLAAWLFLTLAGLCPILTRRRSSAGAWTETSENGKDL
jgi:hypothetical protein